MGKISNINTYYCLYSKRAAKWLAKFDPDENKTVWNYNWTYAQRITDPQFLVDNCLLWNCAPYLSVIKYRSQVEDDNQIIRYADKRDAEKYLEKHSSILEPQDIVAIRQLKGI
jgi:hypothetical protein